MADNNDQQILEGEIKNKALRQELANDLAVEETRIEDEGATEVANEEVAADFEKEMSVANELALIQGTNEEIQGNLNQLQRQGESFRRPSFFKFGVLGSIALVADGIDILLYISGVGILVSFFVSMYFLFILASLYWFTDTKIKRAQSYIEFVESELPRFAGEVEAMALQWGRRGFRFGRTLKKGGLGAVGAKITRISAKVAQVGKKRPLSRIVLLGLANMAPWVAILPLNSISIFLSYRDEKKTYEEARLSSEELGELSESIQEMV